MAHWVKPSGIEMKTNDMKETIEYCESLGWERTDGPAPEHETEETAGDEAEDTTETEEE